MSGRDGIATVRIFSCRERNSCEEDMYQFVIATTSRQHDHGHSNLMGRKAEQGPYGIPLVICPKMG